MVFIARAIHLLSSNQSENAAKNCNFYYPLELQPDEEEKLWT